jgi:hypothetical protein
MFYLVLTVLLFQIAILLIAIKILYKENKLMSELTDLQTAVTNLVTEVTAVVTELQSLEGSTPAPGVLEGLATQLNNATASLQAAMPPASPSTKTS